MLCVLLPQQESKLMFQLTSLSLASADLIRKGVQKYLIELKDLHSPLCHCKKI